MLTSSNVGGAWLAVLNGGLNYQIEHHLFPRIHHSHYAAIAPLVKDFCQRKNIQYVSRDSGSTTSGLAVSPVVGSPFKRVRALRWGQVHFPDVWSNLKSTSEYLRCQGIAPVLTKAA